jgi:TolA-binding protein
MKKYVLAFVLFFVGFVSLAQTQSQLNYCKLEAERLEKEVEKYKGLLEIQNADLMELKLRIVDLNREIKILNHEKKELNKVSESLMDLALKYEERGKFREAMDIYRILIKTFPTTLDAAASKIKVVDLKAKSMKLNK